MPVDLNEVDEVWLALQQARAFLLANGYHPSQDPLNSGGFTLQLLDNGINAYRRRHGFEVSNADT